MTRCIFVVGNESALSRAIEAETANRVDQFAAASISNKLSGAQKHSQPEMPQRISLDWNPSSPISARTLIIAAENRLERIDEAILVCSPPSFRKNAAELPLSDIEIMINNNVKGWFFLIKELTSLFTVKKHGTLVLVYPDTAGSGKDDNADILGPPALASFRALTQCLLNAAVNEPFITMSFSTSYTGNEAAFASFIFKNIDDISKRSKGKHHKFGKFTLFK